MTFLVIFFISLLSTIFLTPYLIMVLQKSGVIDAPAKRKIHQGSIPRMGGLVIFLVVFTLTLTFYSDISSIRFFLLGMIVIAICGSIDDVIGIKWNTKFLLQSIAVALLMLQLINQINEIHFFSIVLPAYVAFPLMFIFLLGTINSVNLMDGMDGLVSSYSLFTASVLFLLAMNINNFFLLVILSAICGSLLGYLKFNGFPARVFLGDFGSLFLGYLLVALSSMVSIGFNNNTLDLAFPILLLSIPIIDTLKVFFKRIFLGKHPFLPDNEHLHHIIYRNRVRHKTTVFLILIYNLMFVGLAVYYILNRNLDVIYFYLPIVLGLIFAKQIFEFSLRFEKFQGIIKSLTQIPAEMFRVTYKIFVPFTIAAVLLITFILFPLQTEINQQNLIIMLSLGVVTLVLAIFHKRYNHQLILNIYFFFNVSIFLIVSSYPNSLFKLSYLFSTNVKFALVLVSLIVVLLFIGLFVVGRERILPKEKIFLTGIDLTMAVFVIGSFFVENLFENLLIINIPQAIFIAYLLYIWFKIIYLFNSKLASVIFITSFLVPITALAYLLLTKLI